MLQRSLNAEFPYHPDFVVVFPRSLESLSTKPYRGQERWQRIGIPAGDCSRSESSESARNTGFRCNSSHTHGNHATYIYDNKHEATRSSNIEKQQSTANRIDQIIHIHLHPLHRHLKQLLLFLYSEFGIFFAFLRSFVSSRC